MPAIEDYFSLTISQFGNLSLVAIFAAALFFPQKYGHFIFSTGLLIFIIEFLNIHSAGLGQHQPASSSKPQKIFLNFFKIFGIFMYMVFIIAVSIVFKNYFLPLYFFISLISKFYSQKYPQRYSPSAILTVWFLASVFIVAFSSKLLVQLIKFPDAVLSLKPQGSSGLFIDYPQTLLIWGITYFLGAAIIDAFIFYRKAKAEKVTSQ